jgi:hypothetical protein
VAQLLEAGKIRLKIFQQTMYDSVFSTFTPQFPNDKLILGEKKVLSDLDNVETKGASLIARIPLEAVRKFEKDQYILSSLKRSLPVSQEQFVPEIS